MAVEKDWRETLVDCNDMRMRFVRGCERIRCWGKFIRSSINQMASDSTTMEGDGKNAMHDDKNDAIVNSMSRRSG